MVKDQFIRGTEQWDYGGYRDGNTARPGAVVRLTLANAVHTAIVVNDVRFWG